MTDQRSKPQYHNANFSSTVVGFNSMHITLKAYFLNIHKSLFYNMPVIEATASGHTKGCGKGKRYKKLL